MSGTTYLGSFGGSGLGGGGGDMGELSGGACCSGGDNGNTTFGWCWWWIGDWVGCGIGWAEIIFDQLFG